MQPVPAGVPVEVRAVSPRRSITSLGTELWILFGLVLLAVAILLGVGMYPMQVPFTALSVPLVLGALLLGPRTMTWLLVLLIVALLIAQMQQPTSTPRLIAAMAILILLCVIALVISVRRSTLGIGQRRGESMLVDLRDRILAQGTIPRLPDNWLVESALSSAGGSPFAGDFVVATTREDGRRLEVAVVDVSGKGEAAGTRALQLSGAMGGLIGALPPRHFLPAANDYLLQRDWDEGFATAVHLSLDLATGDYELRTAGHPPPVQRFAGSGRWLAIQTEGPVLGLIPSVDYEPRRGRLGSGDVLLLYTDGMVEEPRRDIELGIDEMLGVAEQLFRNSLDGLAERLAAKVGSRDDDRALLLVHRR
ncbi:PP2C family protein-serine/threonine phosphatase [Nocardioides sp. HM23]|uniref:PP2C family protein-serine/threonine phosphatase n=1 Tax=Nocardioides bizhenqiangii TaxID=3095076 RepID=UPI002ACA60F7|nr:PP2C family protein-serine/threonine phosphatase [Nocardioides sp. HM23]MDZ5621597.1 PP2C family protein-serine/threonine phosphatase [Nocardioides sp. HM23]